MIYFGIFIEQDTFQSILSEYNIPTELYSNQVKDPHVTLGHVKNFKTKSDMKTHFDLLDNVASFLITGLVFNKRCIAFSVELDKIDCFNKHPHMTIATDSQTKPFYSNELLTLKDATRIVYKRPIKVDGTILMK